MIRNQWEQLTKQHPIVFETNEESWMETLEQLQQFITMNDSLPPQQSKDPTIKKLAA